MSSKIGKIYPKLTTLLICKSYRMALFLNEPYNTSAKAARLETEK